jgi:drug/metabolite transporter (DMT)-like permease
MLINPTEPRHPCVNRVLPRTVATQTAKPSSMIAILLGLFAALCWGVHDLLARATAPRIGPFRLALWVMLVGAALLAIPALQSEKWATADTRSIIFALLLGVTYALGVGGLFKAFSLAPISVVGPFTAGYPALVVLWGVFNGLAPTVFEWLAVFLILAGAAVVSKTGHADGGINAVAPGKLKIVVAASAAACLGYSSSIIMGQTAALTLGEFETTFLSRFPAALMLLPLALRETTDGNAIGTKGWTVILAMAILDVLAVSGINYSGQFDNKELAAMGISAYGGLAVVLAMVFLKERVSPGQWCGIALVVAGVCIMGWPK